MTDILNITLIQSDIVWENIDLNLNRYMNIIKGTDNADIIIFPEMFASGFTMNKQVFNEFTCNKVYEWVRNAACYKKCAIIASSGYLYEGNIFNRMFFVDEKGEEQHYDKKHLFSPGKENINYSAGTERKIFEYKGWRIFPQICYDLRFPVWSRNNLDYDLMINVANWPAARQKHWKALLRARAIENLCYVVGVNRTGTDANNIHYKGGSVVYLYDGEIAGELKGETDTVLSVAINKKKLKKYRKTFGFLDDADKFEIKKEA